MAMIRGGVNYAVTNKFQVRPDYRGMQQKIANFEASGIYNHGYMDVDDALKIFGRGTTNSQNLYSLGFQNATTPTLMQDEVEHKTGLDNYPHKQGSGNSTLDNLTLATGRISTEPYFAKMMLRIFGGKQKLDLLVVHFDTNLFGDGYSMTDPSEALEKYAMIYLYEGCIPISNKIDGDLDGSGGDISIQEMEFAASNVRIFYPRYNEQTQDYETVEMSASLDIADDIVTPL